jgi:hypothetical protein
MYAFCRPALMHQPTVTSTGYVILGYGPNLLRTRKSTSPNLKNVTIRQLVCVSGLNPASLRNPK